MKKVFVFCIGGTGIRVMKSITMLMASGMDTNGYTVVPIIVDPHLDLDEKKNLDSLMGQYKDIHKAIRRGDGDTQLNPLDGYFHSEIKTLGELDSQQNDTYEMPGSKQAFGSYINTSNMDVNDINHHFVSTLFSQKNLESPLSVGFKGNPNVGTVVLGEMIEGSDWFDAFKNKCEKNDRVFIISSIFGGTGASGYPLIEKKIREADTMPAVKNAVMGAVTVLPYYGLKDPTSSGSDIDSANFYTKTKSALAYYEKNVKSDYLYYAGEKNLRAVYDNNEQKQDDKTHFIELVSASALFHFLEQPCPDKTQYLSRAIEDDVDSLDFASMGKEYAPLVKATADYMLLRMLTMTLPNEKYFPLRKTYDIKEEFFHDKDFESLKTFTQRYYGWYQELASNNRAFAPLHYENPNHIDNWIAGMRIDAKDDSYILLKMIQESNSVKEHNHSNKFRFFMQFAWEAVNKYTKKVLS